MGASKDLWNLSSPPCSNIMLAAVAPNFAAILASIVVNVLETVTNDGGGSVHQALTLYFIIVPSTFNMTCNNFVVDRTVDLIKSTSIIFVC